MPNAFSKYDQIPASPQPKEKGQPEQFNIQPTAMLDMYEQQMKQREKQKEDWRLELEAQRQQQEEAKAREREQKLLADYEDEMRYQRQLQEAK